MNKTISIASATYYAMMTMLIPVINGFIGIIFLHEKFGFIKIFAGIIILFSCIKVQKLEF